jgi:hypothetical protein
LRNDFGCNNSIASYYRFNYDAINNLFASIAGTFGDLLESKLKEWLA